MKVEEYDGAEERKILTALITMDPVLAQVAAKWPDHDGLFSSPDSNTIAKMAVDYFNNYGKAPGTNIGPLFRSWARRRPDEQVKTVERYLASLSDDSEAISELSSDLMIEIAGTHFRRTQIKKLSELLEEDVLKGELDKAEERINGHAKIELGKERAIDFLNDKEALKEVFSQGEEEPIITFPGDLGKFYGHTFRRGAFVAYAAPEKTGKSFVLWDLAYRAVKRMKKVAYFEAGDDEHETKLRMAVRIAGVPDRDNFPRKGSYKVRWPLTMKGPKKEYRGRTGEDEDDEDYYAQITSTKIKEFTRPLNAKKALLAFEKFRRMNLKKKGCYLMLSCHPSGTLGVRDIKNELDSWERQGWSPDMVVIDYADIMAHSGKFREPRDSVNKTWIDLRSLSQAKNVLVVTATQANREGYGLRTLDRRALSEDKRKLAHVTALYALNVWGEEREAGVMRISCMGKRKGGYHPTRCVHVATCLALANPTVLSCF